MDAENEDVKGASRGKLARRQEGAAAQGLEREDAVATLRDRKRGDGGAVRGRGAARSRNAGGRVGGEQVARGGRKSGDRTGVRATLRRRGKRGAGAAPDKTATPRLGRARQAAKPGARTRSKARKAGKKK